MEKFELRDIPEKVKKGVYTKQEAVNLLAEFISKNYPIFALQNYDEDFRSNIILCFIEKGNTIFDGFDYKLGDFFNYLYSFINNLVCSEKKRIAKSSLAEKISGVELVRNYQFDYESKQNNKTFNVTEIRPVYSAKNISYEEIKKYFKSIKIKREEKILLSLIIKSSYYLTDEMIKKLSRYLKIDEVVMQDTIKYFNNGLDSKISKRKKLETYRDKAYIYHRKYENQIQMLKSDAKYDHDSNFQYTAESKIDYLKKINKKQISNWEKLTKKFQEGYGTIKPSNQSIAEIIGICERQVSYYLFCAKSGKIDLEKLIEKINNSTED